MEARTRFDAQQAFVFTSDEASKIWRLYEEAGMVVTASVNCSDGIARHFEEQEQLVQYENPKRASITSIEISGRAQEPYATAEVSFGARYSAPISVSIYGEESQVASMRIGITDTLDGMKPWYSRLATFDLSNIWFAIFFTLLLLGQIMAPSSEPKTAVPFEKALSILATIGAVIGTIVAVIWGVAWLRKRFFPVATFTIGQGTGRHQHNEQVRWVIVIGFIVSAAASIATSLLLDV